MHALLDRMCSGGLASSSGRCSAPLSICSHVARTGAEPRALLRSSVVVAAGRPSKPSSQKASGPPGKKSGGPGGGSGGGKKAAGKPKKKAAPSGPAKPTRSTATPPPMPRPPAPKRQSPAPASNQTSQLEASTSASAPPAPTTSALTAVLSRARAEASGGQDGPAAASAGRQGPDDDMSKRAGLEAEEGLEDDGEDGFLIDSEASGAASDDGSGPVGAGGREGDGEDEDGEEAFPEIRLNLPNPSNVKVKTAEYLQSCVTVKDCPPPRYPEFAVIGRSNVGKSSLINMLTSRRDLALVSKEPGKTKCINHFIINNSWYLVDLPGYGFAKVGQQGRLQFEAFTREYFKGRPSLAMVFLLVDASIPPQKIDLDYANWLTDNEVPFTLVFTKADKRRKGLTAATRDSHVTAFKRGLLEDLAFLPPSILTSAAKGLGRGEMLNFIASLRVAFERSGRLEAIRQGML
ncbi:hypothetical protein HYH03_003102 [Edaphochlamys debaryana]|uniref:EngB-type G domain-containing protein n=1 Tax=Edaphochlamys debaryana TaxID=47281 RepID=A0A836C4M7_9CHLO|nr:hypothetical protein HYH03_003102 [Edaphochlamys debaryana]|eukprot:KAG2498912.1 hypothetical protein HYH03_003102 [Edaphochlamys debaryana]